MGCPGAAAGKGGPPAIVLASASPRRAEALRTLGLAFVAAPADVEEARRPDEPPRRYVERLAREKAERVSSTAPARLVVGGDTVVELDGEVLEKPRSEAEAVEMLSALSGRVHVVYTGMALAWTGRLASRVATARVRFRPVSREWAEEYVATGEPMDKAAAYGIQGIGSALVEHVEGDYCAVVGFSVVAFVGLLTELGLDYKPGRIESAGGGASSSAPAGRPDGRRELRGVP